MADFASIRDLKGQLILKPLKGAVLIADMGTAIPTTFTGTGSTDLVDLTGFKSLGHISKDAPPTFTPETETSDVESWGVLEPPRTDVVSRTMSIAWTSQETNKQVLELYSNVDLSGVTADTTTGEVQFEDPTDPGITYHRVIFLGVDKYNGKPLYILKIAPRLTITEVSEQAWSSESALEYAMTGRAKIDADLGYSMKTVFCGPGWKDLAADAGFSVGSTVTDVEYQVAITGAPTGGTFDLSFAGQTATLDFDATVAEVQSALAGLSTIGSGNVNVTGTDGGPFTVTVDGALSGTLTGDGANLTPSGGVTVS